MTDLAAHLYPTAAPSIPDPAAYVAAIVGKSRSSFALGMRTLPKLRRQAMFALYAFSRTVDDIADEPGSVAAKRAALAAWGEEIDGLYAGSPRSVIGQALAAPIHRFHLPKAEFHLMLEGMDMDVSGPIRAPSFERLFAYTRRVAGTVGELSVRIFGAPNVPARSHFALTLADAFQLTNILRDVECDADDGRLYLPKELLDTYGLGTEPHEVAQAPERVAVCRDLGAIAWQKFTEARAALTELRHRDVRPALMMMGVYEGYLMRMKRFDFTRDRVALTLSPVEKIGRSLRYAIWFPHTPPDMAGRLKGAA